MPGTGDPDFGIYPPITEYPPDKDRGQKNVYYGTFTSLYPYLPASIIPQLELAMFYCKLSMASPCLQILKQLHERVKSKCSEKLIDHDIDHERDILGYLAVSLEYAWAMVQLCRDHKGSRKLLAKATEVFPKSPDVPQGAGTDMSTVDNCQRIPENVIFGVKRLLHIMLASADFYTGTCEMSLNEMELVKKWLKDLKVNEYSNIQVTPGRQVLVTLRKSCHNAY